MPRITRVAANGTPTVSDDRTLAEAKAERIALVKDEARRRILAICPEWKQTNLVARGTELLMAARSRSLTAPENAEIAAGQAVWDAIKAIRAASDTAEAAINAATTNAAVEAVPF